MARYLVMAALFCVAAGPAVGQDRLSRIINGLPTDEFPAVGIVGEESVGGFCTGTLISPNHVLTAAHCAEAILTFGDSDSGTFEVAGRVYGTMAVAIIPTYDNRLFTDDIAILILEEPVIDVEPMLMSSFPPQVGELVTLVGFGAAGTPQSGSDGSFGEKSVGFATVDMVAEFEFSWFFDDPTESNAAPGDSGAPVLIAEGGEFLIAGIVSSGTTADAGLGDTNFNMRVDAYSDWITQTVFLASSNTPAGDTPPTDPPPTDPDGTGDDTSDEGIDSGCRPCGRPPGCAVSPERPGAVSPEAPERPGAVSAEPGGVVSGETESGGGGPAGYGQAGKPQKWPARRRHGGGPGVRGRGSPRPVGAFRDASRYSSLTPRESIPRKNVRRGH